MEYKDLSREKLLDMKKTLEAEYEAFRAKGLKLDMSRGKPNKAQLDLTNGMLDTVNSSSDMTASDGMETRNYGGLMGIPECRKLMAEIVGADEKNVIMEIRGGAGGEEAALFAHSLLRMYTMYVQSRGWTLELLNLNETELGGVKEAVFSVEGAGAYNRLKYESGVHRVQRVPETETQGRIHTSTATVAVMPQAEEVDFALDMKDLRIDTFRSSGAGGQHINKTSSAIRVTHIPTGMVVECQNERSQFQNKDKALEILRSRLLAQKQKEQQDAINSERQGQVGTGDRSEKIRTYNFPQDRCTDHRIGLTVHNLAKILDGNLDEVIDALATREQAEKLQKLDL